MKNDSNIVVVIDECGFGTSPLKKYGYSKKGKPCWLYNVKKLRANTSLIAAISINRIEGIQFFFDGGNKPELFADYIQSLVEKLK